MRKLLLATALAMGASLGVVGESQAQVVTIPTLLPGTSPFGGPTVAPGTVIVRLGGRMEFFAGMFADSGDRSQFPSTATNGFANQSFKKQNFQFADYARLYPSVDGVAANGLQYGAFVELRHEGYIASGNGAGGAGPGYSQCGGSSSSASARCTNVYVRREYLYFGAPQFGTLRLGSTDGPSALFETGTFENFNDGGWNGDVPSVLGPDANAIAIPFATVGILYTTTKAVYLSPNFAGFDFGVAYEPTPEGLGDYGGGTPANIATVGGVTTYNTANACLVATPGCATLSSSSLSGNRRKNLIDAAVRYRGTFGPVGLATTLGWIGSQHTGVEAQTNGAPGAGTRFSGLNVGDAGLVVTYGGLSVGGHVTGGKYNGQWGLNQVGATPALWGIGGISYSFGPFIVGASAFQLDESGASGPLPVSNTVGQERMRGYAVGGTYTLAPGVAMFVSYLNLNAKENGANLLGDGITVAGANGGNVHGNQINANALAIGTFVRW